MAKLPITRHGMSHTGTYGSWSSMMTRCSNPNATGYARYGGKGIKVCERWLDFRNFLADMGERPAGTSIDRMDNERGYFLQNCRWATQAMQSKNRRDPGRPKTKNPRSAVIPPTRVTKEKLAEYKAKAKKAGLDLSAWIRKLADEAAG